MIAANNKCTQTIKQLEKKGIETEKEKISGRSKEKGQVGYLNLGLMFILLNYDLKVKTVEFRY